METRSIEVTNCPGCKAAKASATGSEVPGFAVMAGDVAFVQEPYSICECTTCGLLYKNRTLSSQGFADYYAQTDFRKWEIEYFYPTERLVLRNLRSRTHGAAILDFGCSSGRLLAPLVNTYQCFGCEINEHARNEAQAKGITMLSWEELTAKNCTPYDVVVVSDVFEHLRYPTDVLRTLVRLLKVGGNLIVVTGNGDSPVCRLDPAHFWYFRIIEHVVMLTRSHAEWLEKQFLLKLTKWQAVSHYDWNRHAIMQRLRHFAFWRFRRGSKFTRVLLRFLPGFNRAERWPIAPCFCYSTDHVVAVFEK